jgi:hypothetical protein
MRISYIDHPKKYKTSKRYMDAEIASRALEEHGILIAHPPLRNVTKCEKIEFFA